MSGEDFEKAVRDHGDAVHTFAAWLLGDRDAAGDVAQDALVRLWKHREQVEPPSARAWLMTTARRLCVDHVRRNRRQGWTSHEPLPELLASPEAGPDQDVADAQLRRRIGEALGRLSESDRAVLLMREYSDMSYREMAGALSIGLDALKVRLHRARRRLRDHLVASGVRS